MPGDKGGKKCKRYNAWIGYELCWSKDIKMALGTNRLPHPPTLTLEIELLDKPTQAGTALLSKFGGHCLLWENFGYYIIYALTYSREAESESHWLLNAILFGLVRLPSASPRSKSCPLFPMHILAQMFILRYEEEECSRREEAVLTS